MATSSQTDREPPRYRWLLHLDLDQFQVSVERLRRPELIGIPVIVGGDGDPTKARQVVTCASYEARKRGVRAGMALRSAQRKMPDATYLPLDMPAYDEASAQVMDTLRARGLPIEVWGWDEAYLGVQQVDSAVRISDPEVLAMATELRELVFDATGLTCRIGIGDNKQRAKMATGFAKRGVTKEQAALTGLDLPDGVFLLDVRNWTPLMGHRPPRDLWSVGPKTAAKLTDMGIDTVDALAAAPRADLIARFGPHQGNWLYVLSHGGGDATITVEEWVAKSHSKSRTYPQDLTTLTEQETAAVALLDELLAQLREEGRTAFRVAVTTRTATFFSRTTSRMLGAPTVDPTIIGPVIVDLLHHLNALEGHGGRPVRLIAVRCDLVDATATTDG